MRVDATKIKWEKVDVFNKEGLFTGYRVDRNTVPDGYTMYEVRHDDECAGDPVQIANWIMVNFWGTLLVKEPFNFIPSPNNNAYLDIDPENDWSYTGENVSL